MPPQGCRQAFGGSRAGDLGRSRRSGRRPDDQISVGHIQPGIEQAGDYADQPCIACRSAATEDQGSLGRRAAPLGGVDPQLILDGIGILPAAVFIEDVSDRYTLICDGPLCIRV